MSPRRSKRIQLRRTKGWRLPDNTVIVSRPTKWGNPFRIGVHGTREECVRQFRDFIVSDDPRAGSLRQSLAELRGKDLACWCPPGPCHADVLIEMANEATRRSSPMPHDDSTDRAALGPLPSRGKR
jgi:Domain of unknown function (DUF4326)